MPGYISRGKLTPPALDGIVHRERLYAALDTACARPLVWICAPPGSGKTLLVAGYTQKCKIPLIWYQLDRSDTDPAAFFSRLGEAAGPLLQKGKHSLPDLTAANQEDLAAFTLRFFDNFLAHLPSPLFLVLDNHQVLDDGWVEQAKLLDVLARTPTGTTTFITSRHVPPKSSISIQLQRKMEVLFWNDLRFDLNEAWILLGRDAFSEEVVLTLLKKTEGWAAGLVLLGESLRRGGKMTGSSPWIPMQDLFVYLEVELFQKVPAEIRDFLIRTAYLPRITSEMATLVSGNSRAVPILHHLSRTNWLTLHHPLPIPEFEYHPLLALFLQTVAKNNLTPDELSKLLRRSAEVLEAADQLEQAADLLFSAQAYGALEAFILRHAQAMVDQGRFVTLVGWIHQLPDATLEREPWFFYWLAICGQVKRPDESRRQLRQAYEAFERRGDVVGMLTTWSFAVDSCIHGWDEFFLLEEWVVMLEAALDQGLSIPSTNLGARSASSMAGALICQRPERARDIQIWLERAMPRSGEAFFDTGQILAGFHSAYHAMWMGDLSRLRILSEAMQRTFQYLNATQVHLLNAKSLEAMVHSLVNARGDHALAVVREGLALAKRHNLTTLDFMLNGQGVFAALTVGDSDLAEKYLAAMQEALPRSGRFAHGHYHYAAAAVFMYREEHVQALHSAGKALDIAKQTGARFALPFFALAKAQACHESGDHVECTELMQQLDTFVSDSSSRLLRFMWLLCQAHFEADRGREASALRSLRDGFALGRREGYLNMFCWWRPKMMARLCVLALENGVERDYARLLVRRRKLQPDQPLRHLVHWPWPYRIHTLGRFELFREEQPVRFEGKIQHKPLAMLKYLVAAGERGASEQQVCDLLWPESDGDRAHSAFTTTVSRLRQLMGGKDGITVQGGWVALNGRFCWVDAWAFLELCDQLHRSNDHEAMEVDSAGGTAIRAAADLYGDALHALELYAGHFLPTDLDAAWAIAPRERLRERFIQLVAFVGGALERAEEWEQAQRCYFQALEVDDLQEKFYRLMVRCACRLGRVDEARGYLRRCEERLQLELGVTPSPRTMEMARSLGLLNPVLAPSSLSTAAATKNRTGPDHMARKETNTCDQTVNIHLMY